VQVRQADVDADDPGDAAGSIAEGSETAEEGPPAIGVGVPAEGGLSAAKGLPCRRGGVVVELTDPRHAGGVPGIAHDAAAVDDEAWTLGPRGHGVCVV
jgi:hypothetical protein